jgi:ferredoxin/flavodoxin---NADP+ reductase
LQTEELQFSIDMIERLPTPWGLVRSGVAPDHPKIKTVAKVFEKIAAEPGFRLFANVELGSDLTIEQLKESYDAVVIATGSAVGKKLGIAGEEEKDVKSNLDAMLLISEKEAATHERTMKFQFLATPKEIKGDSRVEEVVFQKTGSDETFSIKCGLVITAIGYEATALEGVPYEKGKVVNIDGRVTENIYVVGWAKRGPSGVIGTNKSDAADVMKLLVADLTTPKSAGDITDVITHNRVVTQSHWQAINEAEVAAGEPLGKPRRKAVDREELLRLGRI